MIMIQPISFGTGPAYFYLLLTIWYFKLSINSGGAVLDSFKRRACLYKDETTWLTYLN